MSSQQQYVLSNREENVLVLTMSGLTDKEIASSTELSVHTVRTYWDRIREKLNVNSRAEAIAQLSAQRASSLARSDSAEIEQVQQELEQCRLERDLLEQKRALLEEIVCGAAQLNWTAQPNGDVLFCSDRFYDYTGIKKGQVVDLKGACLHSEDIEQLKIEPAKPDDHLVLEREVRIRRHDGKYRWHLIRLISITDDEGKVLRRVGTAVDIHDMHKRVQDSRNVENRLRLICELSPVGIAFCDPSNGAVYSNGVHDRLTGFKLDPETLGKWNEIFFDNSSSHNRESWIRAVETGTPVQTEVHIAHPDGHSVWALVRALPLRTNDRQSWVILLEDMTPTVQAEGRGREKLLKIAALLEDVLDSSLQFA